MVIWGKKLPVLNLPDLKKETQIFINLVYEEIQKLKFYQSFKTYRLQRRLLIKSLVGTKKLRKSRFQKRQELTAEILANYPKDLTLELPYKALTALICSQKLGPLVKGLVHRQ